MPGFRNDISASAFHPFSGPRAPGPGPFFHGMRVAPMPSQNHPRNKHGSFRCAVTARPDRLGRRPSKRGADARQETQRTGGAQGCLRGCSPDCALCRHPPVQEARPQDRHGGEKPQGAFPEDRTGRPERGRGDARKTQRRTGGYRSATQAGRRRSAGERDPGIPQGAGRAGHAGGTAESAEPGRRGCPAGRKAVGQRRPLAVRGGPPEGDGAEKRQHGGAEEGRPDDGIRQRRAAEPARGDPCREVDDGKGGGGSQDPVGRRRSPGAVEGKGRQAGKAAAGVRCPRRRG